ncbi:MAG: SdpI family protein [Blautia caecimuris]
MIKRYKWTLFAASLMILCPIIVGIIFWDQLPDMIPTHFGSDNQVNGWTSKPVAVFGMPLFLLAMEFFCAFMVGADPKCKNINQKLMRAILWMIPILSVVTNLISYAIALGMSVDTGMVVNILLGIMFVIMGNYMHKIKQNYSVGIKLPWTLNSEENWNRTHRVASWLFIMGGAIFVINGFLQSKWVLFAFLACVFLIPAGYSFYLYKKGI